ncbi:4Fe-4S dicluster domain-containing protein [Parendozoicomonas haliclonae]|uniref:Ferredoxin-type protein n=1 Tax=Parendozoicomonas haliclonae TaxID=1960125 RepID=A0A1X7AFG7_9GAMM|nr:4Fe-4S dicluster domain-containing protein [Parendozoicomonas haliclonae]SMA37592.1 ferredoxin-type protein [Parendozoicomonas haliclonae]
MSEGVSRRGLFRMLGGNEAKATSVPDIPEACPPWARDNRSYLALCERCDLCREACPERLIRSLDSPDPALNGIAVLNLDYGQCTFCGECADACPTGALDREQGTKIQAQVKLAGPCDRILGMPCDMCADSCTEQAITLLERSAPTINLEACTGCGACALSCYSRALTMEKRPA